MTDFRTKDPHGNPIDFTCENSKFKTNLNKGTPPGKVLVNPLYDDGVSSLHLEHVIETKTSKEFYWLMWYKNGQSITPTSGVIDKDNLLEIIRHLVIFRDDLL